MVSGKFVLGNATASLHIITIRLEEHALVSYVFLFTWNDFVEKRI